MRYLRVFAFVFLGFVPVAPVLGASYVGNRARPTTIRISDRQTAPDEPARAALLLATYERAQRECQRAEAKFGDAVCRIEAIDFNTATNTADPAWYIAITLSLCQAPARGDAKE